MHAQRDSFDPQYQRGLDMAKNQRKNSRKMTRNEPYGRRATTHMHQPGIRAPDGTQYMQGGPGETRFDQSIRPLNLVDHASLRSMKSRNKRRRGRRRGGSKTHTRKRKRRTKLRSKTLKN